MRGKKMKHKIYLQFCLIAALAILVTTTIVTALFYQRFKAQVFSDVRTYAYVLTSVDTYDEATLIQEVHQLDNLRVTIIDKEGKVLLDTNADIGGMENHSNREEIKAAFETGEGQAVRQSKTVAKSTFYCAAGGDRDRQCPQYRAGNAAEHCSDGDHSVCHLYISWAFVDRQSSETD